MENKKKNQNKDINENKENKETTVKDIKQVKDIINKKHDKHKNNIKYDYIHTKKNIHLLLIIFIIVFYILITECQCQQIIEIEAQINNNDEINIIINQLRNYTREEQPNEILIKINETYQIYNDTGFNNAIILMKWYFVLNSSCFYSMFENLSNITMINFTNFNGENIKNMGKMFKRCNSLKSIYFNDFDTSHVTSMRTIFRRCISLIYLNLSNFNTSLLRDMSGMFYNCNSLTSIDFGYLNTSSVNNMKYMFAGCNELKELDLRYFNTSSVTDMLGMLEYCWLNSLNLSNFRTPLVSDMSGMFFQCNLLKGLDLTNFNTILVKNMIFMFSGCHLLKSLDLKAFNTSSVNDMSYMFSSCILLESLDLSNFNTSMVINMEYMFYNCYSLKSLNLSNFDTSSVTDMSVMFSNCNSLQSLNLSSFDTSSVNFMYGMFFNCYSLQSLNLNNFVTSSVMDMYEMFYNCHSLRDLEIDNFDILMAYNLSSMFYNCSELISLNLFNFQFSPDYEYSNILNECNEKLIFCVNNNSLIYLSNFTFVYNCTYFCFKKSKKLIYKTNECVDDCFNNLYEYNNICYDTCPNGTINSSDYPYKCVDENHMICDNYYNYEQTGCISAIPTGFFVNDTALKTIDKCHEDCETCVQKSTVNNTNCLSCPNSKFLEFGNCVSNCTNGNVENTRICKCPNDKCQNCSLESLSYNLCISCNTEKEYFPKNDDNSNIISFINCYNKPEGYFLYNNTYHKCYPKCKSCNDFVNETNHHCHECLPNFVLINDSQKSNCYNQTQTPFVNITEYITGIEQFDDLTTIIYINETDKITNVVNVINSNLTEKDDIINDLKSKIIKGSLNSLIESVIQGEKKDLVINDDYVQYQVTSTENQNNNEYKNISNIIFGECENILKEKYKINKNLPLIILKVDYYQPGSLIPIIGYEVFHPINKERLDLTNCKDSLIKFNIPVSINEDNLFKYDPNDEYYTNRCYPSTTESGTDIIINDRQNEYNKNNMSLCEYNCEFNTYDKEAKKSICECAVKTKQLVVSELINKTDVLSYKFKNTEQSSSNMITMKCYYVLFTKNGLLKNIGSYIFYYLPFFSL